MVSPAETPVPQSIDAENSVIGAMMWSPKAAGHALEMLKETDFYLEQNRVLFAAIGEMTEASRPVDAVTLRAHLLETGTIAKAGGNKRILDLYTDTPTAVNIAWYADEVRKTARRRRVIEACTRAIQAAAEPTDDDTFLDMAAATALQLDLVVDEKTGVEPIEDLHTLTEFVTLHQGKLTPAVVPGFINQGDVFMILAPPGAGKTTLSRQVVLAIGAGIHPFNWAQKIEPKRSLLIDLEVDPSTAADETADPLARITHLGQTAHGAYDSNRSWVWSHPEGLNLRKREDQQLLERVFERVRPDFVALGSLYKTGVQARGGESYEVAANEVRDVFDRLRRRWRFALWIEHHMPKAQDGGRKPNPFGSSVWEWWPSHGRVLERAGTGNGAPFRFAQTFRGDRGAREIPVGFYRGGQLPWSPIWDEAELDLLISAAS